MKQYIVLSLFFIGNISGSINASCQDKGKLNDTIILLSVEKVIKRFAKQKEYDSAIHYSYKLLNLSKGFSDSIRIAKTNFRLGFYNKKLDRFKKAFIYYNDAAKIYSSLYDSIESANMLRSMANIQKGLGDFLGSRETALDGLEFLKNSDDHNKKISLYHIISVSFKEEGNFTQALNWNQKALELANELIAEKNILIIKNTEANILAEQKKYSESKTILNSLLKDSLLLRNKTEFARVLSNLGRVKWLENPNNLVSEKQLIHALEIRKEISSISGLISSNTHLANYYSNKDSEKALAYSEDALLNAQKLNNPVSILEVLDLMIPIKTELGLELKEEANLYSNTQKELNQTRQKIRTIYATTKYENDKLVKDNLILKAEKAEKDKVNTMMWQAFFALIALSSFLIYRKNQQKKRAKLEATYETEIRVAKKIHDEVGNDIFYLMTQIKNNPKILKENNGFVVLEGLDKVYQKARDISKEYAPIKTDETFGKELMALLNSYGNDTIKIITNQLDCTFWDSLSKNKKIELFWIVRELMTNMRKYSKATFVGITFSKVENHLELNYNDNGVGFVKTQNNWGNGLKHVETRIQNLKGNFNFDSEPTKGVTAKIMFPI